MSVKVTFFANVQGFRDLLAYEGLASSQVFCVTTLLAPSHLLHLRGPHVFPGSVASTVEVQGVCVCVCVCVCMCVCVCVCVCVRA